MKRNYNIYHPFPGSKDNLTPDEIYSEIHKALDLIESGDFEEANLDDLEGD